MTSETYNTKMEQFLFEEYAALTPETVRQFDEETIKELVTTRLTERSRVEGERDPEFKEQTLNAAAEALVGDFLEERRPTGCYREDGIIQIHKEVCVKMAKATRGDLLSWYSIEPDEANRRYLTSRIKAWDPDKHRTLADLERDLAAKH